MGKITFIHIFTIDRFRVCWMFSIPTKTVAWEYGGDFAVLVVVGQMLIFETFCCTNGLATLSLTAVPIVWVAF